MSQKCVIQDDDNESKLQEEYWAIEKVLSLPQKLKLLFEFLLLIVQKTKMSESDKTVVEDNQIGVSSDTIYIKNAM